MTANSGRRRAAAFLQDNDKEKKGQTGKSVVISKEKGEFTIIQSTGPKKGDDFLVEPKITINLQIDVLEIKPSQTVLLSGSRIRFSR